MESRNKEYFEKKRGHKLNKKKDKIPDHRKCPWCFTNEDRAGGIGVCYKSNGTQRFYRCDYCSWTWMARVTIEIMQRHPEMVVEDNNPEEEEVPKVDNF